MKLNVGSCESHHETLWRKVMIEDTSLIRTLEQVPNLYRKEQDGSTLLWCLLWLAVQLAIRLPHAVQVGYLKPGLMHSNKVCCTTPKLYLLCSTKYSYYAQQNIPTMLNKISLLCLTKYPYYAQTPANSLALCAPFWVNWASWQLFFQALVCGGAFNLAFRFRINSNCVGARRIEPMTCEPLPAVQPSLTGLVIANT